MQEHYEMKSLIHIKEKDMDTYEHNIHVGKFNSLDCMLSDRPYRNRLSLKRPKMSYSYKVINNSTSNRYISC